jgi:hypothetical protein
MAPVAAAVDVPTITAVAGVRVVSPIMPRLKLIAGPVQVDSELHVTVPETMASEPVKLVVKPLTENGVFSEALAVKEEIVAAEAVMVPKRMHDRTAAALAYLRDGLLLFNYLSPILKSTP